MRVASETPIRSHKVTSSEMVKVLNAKKEKRLMLSCQDLTMNKTCFVYSLATAMLSDAHWRSCTAPPTVMGKGHCYIKKQLMG